MLADSLITMLTDGLDPAEAAVVRKAIEREAVKAKVATIKAQDEYAAIVTEQARLQTELDGTDAAPGSRKYKEWYDKNFAAVKANADAIAAYDAKHGQGAFVKAVQGEAPPPASASKVYTQEEIDRMVDARIQGQYGPRWSELMESTGTLLQKHLLAGRKTPIDMKQVAKLATDKFAGNLDLAYDEWDRPEREKEEKVKVDKLVDQRVADELAKRGAAATFPGGADFTPSSLSARTKESVEKYDPQALKLELAQDWLKAGTTAA